MSHTVFSTWVMDWTYVIVCLLFLMSLLANGARRTIGAMRRCTATERISSALRRSNPSQISDELRESLRRRRQKSKRAGAEARAPGLARRAGG